MNTTNGSNNPLNQNSIPALTAAELKPFLKIALQKAWPLLTLGSPGIGKSALIEDVCEEIGMSVTLRHPCIENETDIKGFPTHNKELNICDFVPFEDIKALMTADKPLVCFIDDLGQAPTSVQAPYMQLLHARQIAGKKISPFVRFVAASNGRKDNAGVQGIITPLLSRFHSVVEMVPDVPTWRTWALKKGTPLDLIAFISLRPEMLNNFNPSEARDGKLFACPRTLEHVGDLINAGIESPSIIAGAAGMPFEREYLAFRAMFKSCGDIIPRILKNPQTEAIPQKMDVLYSVLSALISGVRNKSQYEHVMGFVNRLPGELVAFFQIATASKIPEVMTSSLYTEWAVKANIE